jgi:hypothetical protein
MAKSDNPFRWFDSSPEVIQMVVMLYVRFPLSLRNVEDLAFERGVMEFRDTKPNRHISPHKPRHLWMALAAGFFVVLLVVTVLGAEDQPFAFVGWRIALAWRDGQRGVVRAMTRVRLPGLRDPDCQATRMRPLGASRRRAAEQRPSGGARGYHAGLV